MLATVFSQAVFGVDSFRVDVEVHIAGGKEQFNTVGLPDAAVKESKDRVKAAVLNSGYNYPSGSHIIVNLAPADIRKEGPSLDLPIAVGLIGALDRLSRAKLRAYCIVGELSLDGAAKSVAGILPLTLGARDSGFKGIIVPESNANEAAIVEGIEVIPVASLNETVAFLNDVQHISPHTIDAAQAFSRNNHYASDFGEVKGQQNAKRAMEIAAAGGHNLLMLGPPGSGKTMLAKRLPSILPEMTKEESIEITKIHSIAGLLNARDSLVSMRPFRSPHHTISNIALIGGGATPRPGEVSLAHNGVLFLDEMPEFGRQVLEVLRQPLEDGSVNISRASMSLTFPARFLLCGACNPCMCGYLNDSSRACSCSPQQIQKYRSRLSGPLLDRIDIHVEVPAVPVRELAKRDAQAESSEAIRTRVQAARNRQSIRYAGIKSVHCNAHLSSRDVKKFCPLSDPVAERLENVITMLGLSARAYERVIKLSKTIADLAGTDNIELDHISEAINYRTLDRQTQ